MKAVLRQLFLLTMPLFITTNFSGVLYAAELSGYHPGDVFVTRNADESDNTTPGFWNHVAVYVGQDVYGKHLVVEGQIAPGKVIYSQLSEFIARYPHIRLLRLRMGNTQTFVDTAIRQIGTPYRKLASFPVFLRPPERGNNCLSVVRRCYINTFNVDPRWRLPDDLMESPTFKIEAEKLP